MDYPGDHFLHDFGWQRPVEFRRWRRGWTGRGLGDWVDSWKHGWRWCPTRRRMGRLQRRLGWQRRLGRWRRVRWIWGRVEWRRRSWRELVKRTAKDLLAGAASVGISSRQTEYMVVGTVHSSNRR